MAGEIKGSTKRFGTRYGRTTKSRLDKIESQSKKKYKCVYCAAPKVRRKQAGIWECKSCGKTFTGKAYTVN